MKWPPVRRPTVSGVAKVDETSVAITIKQPSAYFLSSLSAGPSKILSQAAGADPDNDGKVTSGPFMLKAWNHGQGLDLAPNPSFYEPVTGVTELNFVFNQDSETGYQLYRTGKVDILGSAQDPIPAARVPEVQDSPDFKSTPAFNTRYVAFNNVIKPFDDVKVRQALAHAIDRETLANAVLGGTVSRPTASCRRGSRLLNCRSPGSGSTRPRPRTSSGRRGSTPRAFPSR